MNACIIRMLFVLLVFAAVFLLRDVQVLAMSNRMAFGARFTVYTVLQFGALALMAAVGGPQPGISYFWTDRQFALIAVLVQVIELAIAIALRRVASGHYNWVGWLLPSPVFLVALFGLSFAIQDVYIALDNAAATVVVLVGWFSIVGVLALALNRVSSEWEDRKFIGDFSMMTSCTALIFVPFAFF